MPATLPFRAALSTAFISAITLSSVMTLSVCANDLPNNPGRMSSRQQSNIEEKRRSVIDSKVTQQSSQDRQEWDELIKRFNDPRTAGLLIRQIWGAVHGKNSKKEEELINLLTLLDPKSARQPALSAREFKNRIASFLDSDDDEAAGMAATLLGVTGDLSFAPEIAKLLDKKDPPADANGFVQTTGARATAAFALALMPAKDYVPKVALMLKSKNEYDRAGAARALGQFKATEYAKDVAELLKPENVTLLGVESPIAALMDMGVGAEYAAEFARIVRENDDQGLTETAAYALAKLRARQHAKDVARLLDQKYRKAHAAKALAIMGATEYEAQIARLLDDNDSLNRIAALTALGIMRSNKYQLQIARHLRDPDEVVRIYAAFVLVLLDADQYAKRIIPLVERQYRENVFLLEGEFHPFVEDELEEISNRFRASFERMKRVNR